jgi:hypothetical protein
MPSWREVCVISAGAGRAHLASALAFFLALFTTDGMMRLHIRIFDANNATVGESEVADLDVVELETTVIEQSVCLFRSGGPKGLPRARQRSTSHGSRL